MATLERAIALAAKYHEGQFDKGGEKYILHPLRLMMKMKEERQRIVAVLHDIVEDTSLTLDDLLQEGFEGYIVEAIDTLTRRTGESYMDFIRRVKQNQLAREIKYIDILDNMDLNRILNPTEEDHKRLAQYRKAMVELCS